MKTENMTPDDLLSMAASILSYEQSFPDPDSFLTNQWKVLTDDQLASLKHQAFNKWKLRRYRPRERPDYTLVAVFKDKKPHAVLARKGYLPRGTVNIIFGGITDDDASDQDSILVALDRETERVLAERE